MKTSPNVIQKIFGIYRVAGTFFYEHVGADVLWFTIGGVGVSLWRRCSVRRRARLAKRGGLRPAADLR